MAKLASKLGKKKITAINEMVSRRASKLGVSPEAALILLAKEHGIGTAIYQRKLDASKQAEVRTALPVLFTSPGPSASRTTTKRGKTIKSSSKPASPIKLAVEYLIEDTQLRERCQDILMGRSHFDRAINQATQVLEDRIRTKAQPAQRLVGENLVGYAFNEQLANTVLQVASNDPDDQRGFTQMLRGIVPAFRNKTHHHITSFSREEALRVVGFIDVLLRVVDKSIKVK